MTAFNYGSSANRSIARKFRYYIRETPDHIWEIEDYHRNVIASFRSREEAFECVRLFVVQDRTSALAVH